MPIQTFWLHHPRILGVRDVGDITLHDLIQADAEVKAMLNGGQPPVHLILDLSRLGTFPRRPSAIAETVAFTHHPKLGHMVMFGVNNVLLRGFLIVLSGVLTILPQFAPSLKDALQFLTDRDATLPETLLDGQMEAAWPREEAE